jgi:periplasmic protein TonB
MKLDLFGKKWLDLVFEGKNKSYGAYELRQENPKTSLKAMLGGACVFLLAMASPLILDMLPSLSSDNSLNEKITTVNLAKPKEEVKIKPKEEKKPEPPKPKIEEVKFVKPKIVEAKKVTEEIKTIDELKDKNIAKADAKADPNADFKIDKPSGEGEKAAAATEDNSIHSSAGIEIQPEFPGGFAGFGKYCSANYHTDDIAAELSSDLKGKVIVEFVVEKNGDLTDIKVVRDLGFGTGAEAIRMLKKCPKWKPGIQNGTPLRVRYSLPISVDIRTE